MKARVTRTKRRQSASKRETHHVLRVRSRGCVSAGVGARHGSSALQRCARWRSRRELRNASCAGERSVVPHPRCALTFEVRANRRKLHARRAEMRRVKFRRRLQGGGVIFRDEEEPARALPREHSRARARQRVGRERPSANGPGLRPPCSPMRWSGRCADPARFFVPQIFSSRGSSRTLFRPPSPRQGAPPTRPALPLRDAASRSDCASPLEATSRGPTRFRDAFSR